MAAPAAVNTWSEPVAEADRPAPAGLDAAQLQDIVLRLSRRLRKHDLAGLTPSQLSTLSTVGESGPLRLGDLAAAERIAPSTLTGVINILAGKGYVRRDAYAADARVHLVGLTDQGRVVLEQIRDRATSVLASILATLADDEVAALADALPALESVASSGIARPQSDLAGWRDGASV